MNTKDLTPKQLAAIRIAVAEIDGWERWKCYDGCVWLTMPDSDRCRQTWLAGGMTKTDQPVEQVRDDCPNYPADLNAVHEVEKLLTGPQWDMYTRFIDDIGRCGDKLPWQDINPSRVIDAYLVHANAMDKCFALLITVAPDKLEVIKANP